MKNLFKKVFIGILFSFLIIGAIYSRVNIVKAGTGSAGNISLGSGTCTAYAGLELNKATYAVGEQIQAGAADYSNGCPGGSASVGAALSYSPAKWEIVTPIPGGGSAFFPAPSDCGSRTIWYRLALTNSSGTTSYSSPIGLTFNVSGVSCTPPLPQPTATPPTVDSLSATSIDTTSVGQFYANVSTTGLVSTGVYATIKERGFCYFKGDPDYVNGTDPSLGKCIVNSSTPSLGVFQNNPGAVGLTSNTLYNYYAYAKNSAGLTGYQYLLFKTKDPMVLSASSSATVVVAPTIDLQKEPLNLKNIVKKNSSGTDGSAYLKIDVNGLAFGGCKLKNNGADTDGIIYGNNFITVKKTVLSLASANNDFQLDCTGSSSPSLKSAIQNVKAQSGTLAISVGGPSCTIAAGASSCVVPLTWTTTSPKVTTYFTGATPATPGNSGNYVSTTINGSNIAVGGTTKVVTIKSFNKVDADNNSVVDVPNELASLDVTVSCALNSTWNGTICSANAPDLIASTPTPNPDTAIINVSKTFTSTITNQGTGGTGPVNVVFQVAEDVDGIDPNPPILLSSKVGPLGAGGFGTATATYKFTQNKEYSVRFCADEDASWNSGVAESNASGTGETNNCSYPWTTVEVSTPDLIASDPTPNTANVGTPQTFNSTITNNGIVGTQIPFNNFFLVCGQAAVVNSNGDKQCPTNPSKQTATSMNALDAAGSGNNTGVAQLVNYTFASTGTYSVRACADNNTSWVGKITESKEDNNCSDWTNVVVLPMNVPVVTLTATPSSGTVPLINPKLTWTVVPNATSCTSGGDWGVANKSTTSGSSEVLGVLGTLKTYTYTLYCTNASGQSNTATASIVVSSGGPAVTVDVSVIPTSATILKGRSATIQWTSTGATSCSSPDFPLTGSTSGTYQVSPVVSTVYHISCTNGSKTVPDSAKVKVIIPKTVDR